MPTRAVVTVVLLLLLAVACGGESGVFDPETGSASTTTTAAAPVTSEPSTTAPEPSDSVAGREWARVSHDDALFGGAEMRAAAALGEAAVAVGFDDSGEDRDAAVWVSPDGAAWTRVPHEETVFGGLDDQEMRSVAPGGPGMVAVGSDYSGGDQDAAVWVSTDGLTWERVPHDEAVFGGANHQVMLGVAAGGPGMVAVGWSTEGDEGADAAVWVSADGLTWERVPHDRALFGGPNDQVANAVTAGGPGMVAVGYFADADGDRDAAVWVSADGLTWERVAHDQAVFEGPGFLELAAITVGGPGLVAVGSDNSAGDIDAAVWVSTDGLTWERVPHDEAVFGGPDFQGAVGVAAGAFGLVAVGYSFDAELDRNAAVWVSTDARAWERVAAEAVFGGPDSQQMTGITATARGRLIAVGEDWADRPAAAVWISPPPG